MKLLDVRIFVVASMGFQFFNGHDISHILEYAFACLLMLIGSPIDILYCTLSSVVNNYRPLSVEQMQIISREIKMLKTKVHK
jgi:hypothetical protein